MAVYRATLTYEFEWDEDSFETPEDQMEDGSSWEDLGEFKVVSVELVDDSA